MVIVNIILMTMMAMFMTEAIITLKPMAIETFKWLLEDDTEEVNRYEK